MISSNKQEGVTDLPKEDYLEPFVQCWRIVSKHDFKRLEAAAGSSCSILRLLSFGIAPSLFEAVFECSPTFASNVLYCNKDTSGSRAFCKHTENILTMSVIIASYLIRADKLASPDVEHAYFKNFLEALQAALLPKSSLCRRYQSLCKLSQHSLYHKHLDRRPISI